MAIIPIIILIIIALMIVINFSDSISTNKTNSINVKNNKKQDLNNYKIEFTMIIENSFHYCIKNAITTTSNKFGDDREIMKLFIITAIGENYKILKKEFINNPIVNSFLTNEEIIKIIEDSKIKVYNLY